jgi:hypothetical protein
MRPGSSHERIILENDDEVADLEDAADKWARSKLEPLEPATTDSRYFSQFEIGDGLAQYLDGCNAPVELREYDSRIALHVLRFAKVHDPSEEIRSHASEMLEGYELQLNDVTQTS